MIKGSSLLNYTLRSAASGSSLGETLRGVNKERYGGLSSTSQHVDISQTTLSKKFSEIFCNFSDEAIEAGKLDDFYNNYGVSADIIAF
jgi:hypothetical protein